MKYRNIFVSFLAGTMVLLGCHKDFLSSKPDKALFVPKSLEELRAILDNVSFLNRGYPYLGYIASDEFYIPNELFNSLSELERATYVWDREYLEGMVQIPSWEAPYMMIFYTNVVIDALNQHEDRNQEVDHIHGTALFFRVFAYHHLSQYFCAPYVSGPPETSPGLVLKTQADVNEDPQISTLKETFELMLQDLVLAADLLPETTVYSTRPNRIAACALLSRIHLEMGNHEQAHFYANAVLERKAELLDYKLLNSSSGNPFPVSTHHDNKEVLFYAAGATSNYILSGLTSVDTNLYRLYESGDLRRALLFTTNENDPQIKNFIGHYTGINSPFVGLALNEILLIRAETAARLGDHRQALEDLNHLLSSRYDDSWEGVESESIEALLKRIVLERRKELIGRSLRWYDIRRFADEANFQVGLERFVNGKMVQLTPADQPFIFPIPLNQITDLE